MSYSLEIKKVDNGYVLKSLEIKKVDNGYVLKGLEIKKVDNGYVLKGESIEVVRECDDADDLAADEAMLWAVMEYFGFFGSKHDPERIRVIRERNKVE